MSTPTTPRSDQLHEALSRELLRLAEHEEALAFGEAERVHYWESMPVRVTVHRHCATTLRAAAEEHAARPVTG